MRSTATNIPDAEYVHHKTESVENNPPSKPLEKKIKIGSFRKLQDIGTNSRVTMTPSAPTPTIGNRQYPRTEATRYASIPCSDIRFKRV